VNKENSTSNNEHPGSGKVLFVPQYEQMEQLRAYLSTCALFADLFAQHPLQGFLSNLYNIGFSHTIKILYEQEKNTFKEIASSPTSKPLTRIFAVSKFFNGQSNFEFIDHMKILPMQKITDSYMVHPVSWTYNEPKSLIIFPRELLSDNSKILLAAIIKIVSFILTLITKNYNEEQLKAEEQEFVSFASHQLKVPLSSLKSGLDIIRREKFGKLDWRYEKIVEIMVIEIQNMKDLILRLLDLSRLQSQISPQYGTIHIIKVIRDVFTSLQSIKKEKELEFKLICHHIVEDFSSDEMMIKQIFMNLIHNACSYSPLKGKILIILSFDRAQSLFHFKIVDEGPGIEENKQAFIFDKFTTSYQISSEMPSTGLGLAICKKIVKMFHGEIHVESPATPIFELYGIPMHSESKGSAFVVQLPLKSSTDQVTA
jgi:signal transduction histidine kinase